MKPSRISLLLLAVCLTSLQLRSQVVQWPIAGQGATNLRNQPAETFLGPGNASTLVPKWIFTTGGDVSATPTVSATAVFVPDWAGNLFAISLATGQTLWSHLISDYDNSAGAVTRVSPALYNNSLIIGDSEFTGSGHNGANVIAIDQQTGALLWITQIESHPAAIITGSPVVVGNVVYEGVSSAEEGLATEQGYACCTFRGSMVALDAATGQILWKRYTIPDNDDVPGKYSGGPIWQPPAIDTTRNLLYVGTGNNYTVPQNVETCRQKHPDDNSCDAASDHFDSALALDLTTGEIKWYRSLYGYDAWNQDCLAEGPYCPNPAGPDYDLPGSGPNLIGNTVGFAQKSGVYWALDADTGDTVWSESVGPGGSIGGIEWGTASDGTNIYIASANSDSLSYTLMSGQEVTWGFWNAVNATDGSILWQVPDPTQGTIEPGAVSVANGVVYAGSYDADGHVYALNNATGQILWSYATGGSVVDGPSIVAGNVIWGSGYNRIPPGTANNKVYDFTPAPAVTVSAPLNGSTVTSPVQFTASAASPNCSNGISAMRIYTAPGVAAYTVDASSLNTSLTLAAGTYNTVVQSWDNCGNVGKTFVTITVGSQ